MSKKCFLHMFAFLSCPLQQVQSRRLRCARTLSQRFCAPAKDAVVQGVSIYVTRGDGSILWSAEATDNTSYRYVRFEIAVSLRAFSAAGFKVYGSPNDVNPKFV